MVENLLVALYCSGLVASAGVVWSSNPVHAVLALVLVFVFGGGVLLLLGLEFVSFTLLVVYVGAIAVLFLFVVMMLKVRRLELSEYKGLFAPLGAVFAGSFVCTFYAIFYRGLSGDKVVPGGLGYVDWSVELDLPWNSVALAEVFFRHHVVVFLALGFILLCAMVGAIGLTVDIRGWYIGGSKRQDIFVQVARDSSRVLRFIE